MASAHPTQQGETRRLWSFAALRRILPWLVALGWFQWTFAAVLARHNPLPGVQSGVGIFDFEVYYRCFRVLLSGGSPYHAVRMPVFRLEHGIPVPSGDVIFLLNYPPWVLVTLAPVLVLPFRVAAMLWCVLNVLFVWAVTAILAPGLLSKLSFRRPELLILLFLFPPIFDTLLVGQVGLLIAAVLAIMLSALRKGKPFVAGMTVPWLALKPHVFLFPLLVVAVWTIRTRSWRLIGGAACSLGALLVAGELLRPGITKEWLLAMPIIFEIAGLKTNGGTLTAALLRVIQPEAAGIRMGLMLGPQLAALAVFCRLLAVRTDPAAVLALIPWALLIGTIVPSYGHFHDQSSILVVVVLLVGAWEARMAGTAARGMLPTLAFVFLLILLFMLFCWRYAVHLFGLPVVLMWALVKWDRSVFPNPEVAR